MSCALNQHAIFCYAESDKWEPGIDEGFAETFGSLRGPAVVGACTVTKSAQHVSDSIEFDANSPKAIVVVGLKFANDRTLAEFYAQHWFANWYSYDLDSEIIDSANVQYFAPVGSICEQQKESTSRSRQCITENTQYHIHEVEPGTYILATFLATSAHYYLTLFFEHEPDDILGIGSLMTDTTLSTADVKSHRFQVSPGEIVYIGDFHWIPVQLPAKLIAHRRDDDDARRALDGYPGIAGEMIYRPPLDQMPIREASAAKPPTDDPLRR